jgi:pimeloyl-ACP methyl ester carboxylesterase
LKFSCKLFLTSFAAFLIPASASATAPSLTVVDPYLLAISASNTLPVTAVVTGTAAGKATAKGIMADSTSAAIAVYKTGSSKNVTFTVTNGAKVAGYNPAFLTTVASPGASSVVVTPTLISGSYYALALVTSSAAPDADHGADIVVQAASAGSSKSTFSLLTLPTPVVLVHGLWGGLLSLASTEGYLKATPGFTSHRALVTPICYSDYLAFDAATDTLPHHGGGCELTSAQALDQYFSATLFRQLDTDHYVGGRVDAVVHSMGGLVARHYESTTHYKSVRNRMLGSFRNVVTLDTPETGSALATYLDTKAFNRTFDGNPYSDGYLVWSSLCGNSPTVTVETCFDSNGLPLSYPGKPLNTGAVYSLIPGGPSLKSAPRADIFNTPHGKWFAISSDFKDGDKPPALLRDLLNTLVGATYGANPPTVTGILGTPDSDVIVTVAGQTATAVPDQVKEFKNLQHTPAPSDGKLLFPGDSNASVVQSPAINAHVAFWLGLQSSITPAVDYLGAPALEESAGESGRAPVKAAFLAGPRLSVLAPDHSVGLGQPVLVPLKLTGPRAVGFNVTELDLAARRPLTNELRNTPSGSNEFWSLKQDDGATAIELVPLQTGPVRVRVQVLFADGGLAQQDFELHVVPSQRRLEQFDLNKGFHTLALVLEDRDQDRQAALSPVVQFETLKYPIYISTADSLNLTVEQSEDDPVIQVDSTGVVHALRPGTALITGDFDGIRDTVQVDVYSQQDAPSGYRRNQD